MSTADQPGHAAEELARLCRANSEYMRTVGAAMTPGIGFDLRGVQWLDAYIDLVSPTVSAEQRDELTELLGCYYGECLINTLGGAWAQSGGKLGVAFSAGTGTVPFEIIARQLAGEVGASVLEHFYGSMIYFGSPAHRAVA